MRPGQRVQIFEDPITQEKPEGMAILIDPTGSTDFDLGQQWNVQFDDDHDGDTYTRWVGGPKAV